MPRFLIKRVWGDIDQVTMTEYARLSRQIGREQFPEMIWEHSHVVVAPDGNVLSFCVYQAADTDVVLKHSRAVGSHFVDEIFEISGDVSPADFPSLPAAGGPGR